MLIKFVRSIQQKVGKEFPSTDFWNYFRKIIIWIEELVQADNKQLPSKNIKTLYIYMVFSTQGIFEVAIESWPEWDYDHWIPFRRSNRLSYQAMSSTCTQSHLCTATPISSFVLCHISFRLLPSSVATLFELKVSWGNHMSVAEWADTYGIHHWMILWSSCSKLAWVRFESTTTYIYIYIYIYLLEPSKTSKMEPFANLVKCIQPLTIFAKHSILGVSQMCLW